MTYPVAIGVPHGECNWCSGTPDSPRNNDRGEPCPCSCHPGPVGRLRDLLEREGINVDAGDLYLALCDIGWTPPASSVTEAPRPGVEHAAREMVRAAGALLCDYDSERGLWWDGFRDALVGLRRAFGLSDDLTDTEVRAAAGATTPEGCTCGPVPNDGRFDDPACPHHGATTPTEAWVAFERAALGINYVHIPNPDDDAAGATTVAPPALTVQRYLGVPGQVVRYVAPGKPGDGGTSILCCRKSSGDGWWLRHRQGGLADHALTSDRWELLDEFTCPHEHETGAAGSSPAGTPQEEQSDPLLRELDPDQGEENGASYLPFDEIDDELAASLAWQQMADRLHGGQVDAVQVPATSAEETIAGLMSKLATSVDEAKAARDRKLAADAEAAGTPQPEEATDG